MSPQVQGICAPARVGNVTRPLFWLGGVLFAVLCAAWLNASPVQAGTITIVDGSPSTLPTVDGVYTDGYIQRHLTITGSLTISTTGVGSGVDKIQVLEGAVITWTTGSTLVLDAGSRVVISGTLQHDGPSNGAGGLRLLASGVPNGTVIIGTGDQATGVAAGSRFGLTRVQAGNLVLQGGDSGTEPYAMLGYHAVDQGADYAVTGPISVTVSQNVTATGGAANYAFVQIGHGGADSGGSATESGAFSGTAAVRVGGNVTFQGGGGNYAYAQLGNGGTGAMGNHSGGHRLSAGGDVAFQGGGGNIANAQLGNGGYGAIGNHGSGHSLSTGGDVTFQGGGGNYTYAHLGNGGFFAAGSHSGGHSLNAGGNVTFQGGSGVLYSSYSQLGNGGFFATGSHSGGHRLDAGGDVIFLGGSGVVAYAQLGNGGADTGGSHSGSLTLVNTGSLTMARGSSDAAYAMIGHGSDIRANPAAQSGGSRAGDIDLRVGATAVFSTSQVGHLTTDGVLSVTQGSTLIGVSQNNPYSNGSGQLLVTGVTTTSFSSAPNAVGGQLRIYLPRSNSQQIPTNATFNGATFLAANTIPPAQLAGFAQFGDGPYIPDYSFYLGGRPDLSLAKAATPAGPLSPDQTITYTVSISNTGNVTATGVVVTDTLPTAVFFSSATPQPDAGVTITQTGSAPNLAWNVSALGPGKGVKVVIAANVLNSALVLGTTFTNTAVLTGTGDITLSNNVASVARNVVAGATLVITKSVVGTVPGSPWQFSGSGGIGGFALPGGGGSQSFAGLIPTTYTITESTKSGYSAAVSCTSGASGTNSVQVTLAPGSIVGCSFSNTFVQVPPETGSVQGTVVDENDNGIPNVEVTLSNAANAAQSAAVVDAVLVLTDTTDAGGNYGFDNVPAGAYTLTFVAQGYVSPDPMPVEVAEGEAKTIDPVVLQAAETKHSLYLPTVQSSSATQAGN